MVHPCKVLLLNDPARYRIAVVEQPIPSITQENLMQSIKNSRKDLGEVVFNKKRECMASSEEMYVKSLS